MKYVCEIENLSKKYLLFDHDYKIIPWLFTKKGNSGVKNALNTVNLKLAEGEVLGVIGANGAGKSTLMNLIAGITFPTTGNIVTRGRVGSLINLGAGFISDYTGRENIYYKGSLLDYTASEIDAMLPEIIEFAEIGDYFDMPIRTYSSGMKARLGFALAIMMNPDILIIDEVFAVGDRDFREKSAKKMKELFNSGKSIIFSSHSDNLIREFCTRVVYIQDGDLVFDGDVEEGLELYQHEKRKKHKERNRVFK